MPLNLKIFDLLFWPALTNITGVPSAKQGSAQCILEVNTSFARASLSRYCCAILNRSPVSTKEPSMLFLINSTSFSKPFETKRNISDSHFFSVLKEQCYQSENGTQDTAKAYLYILRNREWHALHLQIKYPPCFSPAPRLCLM